MPDFRFRLPSINELTDAQQIAYYEKRPILITGGPGSGKTVVSIFRYLREIGNNQNAMFFTFNRTLMSAIRGTLQQKADLLFTGIGKAEIDLILASKIGSFFEWYGANFHVLLSAESKDSIEKNLKDYLENTRAKIKYEEIFIDESQDLNPMIINASYIIAKKITCGADRSQDLQGHYIQPADDNIYQLLNAKNYTVRQELTQNFRNTREIFEFARKFVPEDSNVQLLDIQELNSGEKPDIRGGLDEKQQLDTLLKVVQQYPNSNIGIIVHTKKQIILIKEFLESNGYTSDGNPGTKKTFSYYYSAIDRQHKNEMEKTLQSPFILTFESCKGLEFDIVIMPFFEKTDWALNNFKPTNDNPELDAKGLPKFWAKPNHYYVAATRARSQLYVLYNGKPNILSFYKNENIKKPASKDIFDLPF